MRTSSNSTFTDAQNKTFGAEMRRLRKEAELSTRDFAKYIGVSQTYIYNLEVGKRKPSPQLAKKIADTFDMAVKDMLKPYDEKVTEERVAFGKKLTEARINKGYSVSLVAGALGIPTAIYKEYEQGACSITEREIEILNSLLGLCEEPTPTEVEVEVAEEVVAEESVTDVPTEICDIIMEHITDLKVDKDTQKKVWRFFSNMKLDAEERRLFG